MRDHLRDRTESCQLGSTERSTPGSVRTSLVAKGSRGRRDEWLKDREIAQGGYPTVDMYVHLSKHVEYTPRVSLIKTRLYRISGHSLQQSIHGEEAMDYMGTLYCLLFFCKPKTALKYKNLSENRGLRSDSVWQRA